MTLSTIERIRGGAAGGDGGGGGEGTAGPPGPPGPKGDKGDQGDTGTSGAPGATGSTGPAGPQGPSGAPGSPGAAGAKGDKGDTGDTGPAGATGAQGAVGATGPTGPQGTAGTVGPQGIQGPAGPKGDTGDAGPTGPTGATGATGATGPAGTLSPPYVGTGAATDVIFGTIVTGDAFNRVENRADGSFWFGTGTAAPATKLVAYGTSALQVDNSTFGGSLYLRNDVASASGSSLGFTKSRTGGASNAGDNVGNIVFQGHNGTSLFTGASIAAYTSEAGAAGRGVKLAFNTALAGTTGSVGERMRLLDRLLAIGGFPSAPASTSERLRLNTPTTPSATATVNLAPDAVGIKPLVVQGLASQTANLIEAQDSTGAVLWAVGPTGSVTAAPDTRPIAFKTAAYTITGTDFAVWGDTTSSAFAFTLPTAVGRAGQSFEIKDWKGTAATNNLTVNTTSSQTIDGATSKVLNTAYQCLTVRSDGANWGIV